MGVAEFLLMGAAGAALGGLFASSMSGGKSPSTPPAVSQETGKLTEPESADIMAKKKLFRSGYLLTTTQGLSGDEPLAQSRLR